MKIFVERKSALNTEAQYIDNEVRNYLGIHSPEKARLVWGYEIHGLTKEEVEKNLYQVFATREIDLVSFRLEDQESPSFSYCSLESQYDQKGEAAATILQTIFRKADIEVVSFRVVLLPGLSSDELAKVKKYLINPLESREVKPEDPLRPVFSEKVNGVETIEGFIGMNQEELAQVKADYGISMAMADLLFCQNYFIQEDRNPTLTELKILDTYWSDHCRHSTFLTVVDELQVEEGAYKDLVESTIEKYQAARKLVYDKDPERADCLMDLATIQAKKLKRLKVLTNLEESDEVNACSIEVKGKVDGKEEDFIIMFKNETHNHPTEMEPFGGAATCIGGGIRDPLSGRSYVFGAMRVTGSGDPREAYEDTLEGKRSQRQITTLAAEGYSAYANEIGLASGYLNEYYDSGFKAKRLECGALVSYNYKKNILRQKPIPGDVVLLVGGRTGRDGIGGATGSSKQQVETSQKHSAEVQKGDAALERNIVRLFRTPEVSRIIKKCNDFGAGGVSVAIGELAGSLDIDLNQVALKYPGLDGTEIAISESQERMAVLVAKEDAAKFIEAAEKENLEAAIVARVTDTGYVTMTFNGEQICHMTGAFLNSGGVRQHAKVQIETHEEPVQATENKMDELLNRLSDLNAASKKALANQFDKNNHGVSVLYPFGGKYECTPEAGLAMRLPLEKGYTDLGTIMTLGYNPKRGYTSPFHMGMDAVLESVMKIIAMGGALEDIRLSFQEYFESMKTPASWGKVYSALLGAFLVQEELDLAAIGGKDSMSGTYKDINVPPSLMSFALAPCDTRKLISRTLQPVESNLYLLKTKMKEDQTPDFASLKENIIKFKALAETGKVLSAGIVGGHGIALSASEMSFGNKVGVDFDTREPLFAPSFTDIIIQTEEILDLPLIGHATEKDVIRINGEALSLEEGIAAWQAPLESVMASEYKEKVVTGEMSPSSLKWTNKRKSWEPKVFIPIFPGTTGEYSLIKRFEEAGAKVNTVLFRTRHIEESYAAFIAAIQEADLIALPSGMSAGGKPEATAKMIVAIFRHEGIQAAVNELLQKDGLIMGLGEGFKALIELGLIENECISEQKDSLMVTRNLLGKYYSGLVEVKENSVFLPWVTDERKLAPLSIMDGRILVNEKDFVKYREKGQILAYYINEKEEPGNDFNSNPCGSDYAIEAMTSEHGKVFGRMADVSVLEKGLYINRGTVDEDPMFQKIIAAIKEEKR